MPSDVWLFGSENALRENEVQDIDDQHTSIQKNARGYCETDIRLLLRPCDPKAKGDSSCHTEAKHHRRRDKFVVSPPVLLENCHVGGSEADIHNQENGTYWHIGYC
jgi:hypothetical protein